MNRNQFRLDINGLRAWAVIFVILFHFGIPYFTGGFVGVDIFFVISGFLMTGIIYKGLSSAPKTGKKFSIINFYVSRAKRIIPALLVVCATLLIFGWFIFTPSEYQAFAKQLISAIGFFSNILFWRQAGYFDAASHTKLLLHTWSLSVEWQFYLIFPIFLAGIWKIYASKKAVVVTILIALLLSLTLSIVATPSKPSLAFYLLPTRAWEMLAGSLVYLLSDRVSLSKQRKVIVENIGFIMILASVFIYDANSAWPGSLAMLPVAGTAFVLIAANDRSYWTGSKLAQWIGSASYSLYLWHWPIVVMLAYYDKQHVVLAILGGMILTGVTGSLSYIFIENKTRFFFGHTNLKSSALIIGIPCVLLMGIGATSNADGGIPSRLPKDALNVANFQFNTSEYRIGSCFLREEQGFKDFADCGRSGVAPKTLLWGDSHAAHLYPGLINETPAVANMVQLTASGCPPILDMTVSDKPMCRDINTHISEWIVGKHFDRVILAGNWATYDWGELSKTISFLKNSGVTRIVVVGPVPEWKENLPNLIIKYAWRNGTNDFPTRFTQGFDTDISRVDKEMRQFSNAQGVTYFSAVDILCNADGCLDVVGPPGARHATAWDYGHLTTAGSEYLVAHFPSE